MDKYKNSTRGEISVTVLGFFSLLLLFGVPVLFLHEKNDFPATLSNIKIEQTDLLAVAPPSSAQTATKNAKSGATNAGQSAASKASQTSGGKTTSSGGGGGGNQSQIQGRGGAAPQGRDPALGGGGNQSQIQGRGGAAPIGKDPALGGGGNQSQIQGRGGAAPIGKDPALGSGSGGNTVGGCTGGGGCDTGAVATAVDRLNEILNGAVNTIKDALGLNAPPQEVYHLDEYGNLFKGPAQPGIGDSDYTPEGLADFDIPTTQRTFGPTANLNPPDEIGQMQTEDQNIDPTIGYRTGSIVADTLAPPTKDQAQVKTQERIPTAPPTQAEQAAQYKKDLAAYGQALSDMRTVSPLSVDGQNVVNVTENKQTGTVSLSPIQPQTTREGLFKYAYDGKVLNVNYVAGKATEMRITAPTPAPTQPTPSREIALDPSIRGRVEYQGEGVPGGWGMTAFEGGPVSPTIEVAKKVDTTIAEKTTTFFDDYITAPAGKVFGTLAQGTESLINSIFGSAPATAQPTKIQDRMGSYDTTCTGGGCDSGAESLSGDAGADLSKTPSVATNYQNSMPGNSNRDIQYGEGTPGNPVPALNVRNPTLGNSDPRIQYGPGTEYETNYITIGKINPTGNLPPTPAKEGALYKVVEAVGNILGLNDDLSVEQAPTNSISPNSMVGNSQKYIQYGPGTEGAPVKVSSNITTITKSNPVSPNEEVARCSGGGGCDSGTQSLSGDAGAGVVNNTVTPKQQTTATTPSFIDTLSKLPAAWLNRGLKPTDQYNMDLETLATRGLGADVYSMPLNAQAVHALATEIHRAEAITGKFQADLIRSAYRSPEEQAQIWANKIGKDYIDAQGNVYHVTDPKLKGQAAAKPGLSRHQYGAAFDLNAGPVQAQIRADVIAGITKLTTAKPNDPSFDTPHIQLNSSDYFAQKDNPLINPADTRTPITAADINSGYSEENTTVVYSDRDTPIVSPNQPTALDSNVTTDTWGEEADTTQPPTIASTPASSNMLSSLFSDYVVAPVKTYVVAPVTRYIIRSLFGPPPERPEGAGGNQQGTGQNGTTTIPEKVI